MPLFSVLIANFNNGRFLKEALESVYKQTYTNWEIIIVDDYSTDNSLNIYETLENNSKVKIYFNGKNEGVGYTKRRCIEEANGEICGFLDPDDALAESALEKMVKCHLERVSTSIVHSKHVYCDEKFNIREEYTNGKNVESFNPDFFNLDGEISHFCTFKKEMYIKTVGIDPYLKRAADLDLYLKLYDIGETFFLDEFLYFYRIHDGGISTHNNVDKAYFWRWVVNLNAAKRRDVNIENLFLEAFVPKMNYDYLFQEYWRLKKYKKVNSILHKVNSFFRKIVRLK